MLDCSTDKRFAVGGIRYITTNRQRARHIGDESFKSVESTGRNDNRGTCGMKHLGEPFAEPRSRPR